MKKHYIIACICTLCVYVHPSRTEVTEPLWTQQELIPQKFAKKYRTALVLMYKKLQDKLEEQRKLQPQNKEYINWLEKKIMRLKTLLEKAGTTTSQDR